MTLKSQRKTARRMYVIIKFRKAIVLDLDLILRILKGGLGQRRNKRSVIQKHLIGIGAGKFYRYLGRNHIKKTSTEAKGELNSTDRSAIVVSETIDTEESKETGTESTTTAEIGVLGEDPDRKPKTTRNNKQKQCLPKSPCLFKYPCLQSLDNGERDNVLDLL